MCLYILQRSSDSAPPHSPLVFFQGTGRSVTQLSGDSLGVGQGKEYKIKFTLHLGWIAKGELTSAIYVQVSAE